MSDATAKVLAPTQKTMGGGAVVGLVLALIAKWNPDLAADPMVTGIVGWLVGTIGNYLVGFFTKGTD